jgi:hypothetical protein
MHHPSDESKHDNNGPDFFAKQLHLVDLVALNPSQRVPLIHSHSISESPNYSLLTSSHPNQQGFQVHTYPILAQHRYSYQTQTHTQCEKKSPEAAMWKYSNAVLLPITTNGGRRVVRNPHWSLAMLFRPATMCVQHSTIDASFGSC